MGRMNLTKLQMLRDRMRPDRYEGDGGRRMTYDEPWTPERPRRMTYDEPDMRRRYQTRGEYGGAMPEDRRMGFGADDDDMEMRRRRRRDGTFMHYGGGEEHEREPIRFGGMVAMEGGKSKHHMRMTREMAEEWVGGLESSDPAKPRGAKWSMEQIKPIAQKYGIPTEGEKFYEFFAVINALYSDYYAVAKKYNALNVDFFADMAMAWISDKDAVENKAAMYYECIVEK